MRKNHSYCGYGLTMPQLLRYLPKTHKFLGKLFHIIQIFQIKTFGIVSDNLDPLVSHHAAKE